jgi:uncharacterized protein DUF1194
MADLLDMFLRQIILTTAKLRNLPAALFLGRQLLIIVYFSFATIAARAEGGATQVDAEIILAVDVSYSMDADEQKVQRLGYIEALTSPEFSRALQSGPKGSIALAYVEWAGAKDQQIVIGWRLIDGAAAARKFADELAEASFRRAFRTSIAGSIDFSASLFAGNGFTSPRRIIDISGDGPNNDGRLVTSARDDAVARGITINGLPLLIRSRRLAFADIENLDRYYADCVIGGEGAFIVPVKDTQAFVTATRTKLVLEISNQPPPEPRISPAQTDKPRVSCTIGETLLHQRLGN